MKARLAAGETLFGTFLTLGSPFAAESLGLLGWDWLLVDLEHGGGDESLLVGQLMGCSSAGVHALAVVVEHGYAGLVDSPAPPVRRVEELRPRSVTRLASGAHLVDLGQNVNGWVRLSNLGPAGTELTLTHGEWLGPDGDLTRG